MAPTTADLTVGEDLPLVATGPSGDVTSQASFSSDDDGVATVSGSGVVTAVGEGMCEITVVHDGNSAICEVTVEEA